MKHLARTFSVVFAMAVAAVPAILADPSFAHYVAQHPWAVTYLPIASGILHAVYKAFKDTTGAESVGASTGK